MRAVLIENHDPKDGQLYWSLTVGKEYEVIGIEADDYRIVDDTGDPVLFNPACFKVVDSTEPVFWQSSHGAGGERYAYPPEWGEPGFFEDYHDRVESVRQRFWEGYRRHYGEPDPPSKPPMGCWGGESDATIFADEILAAAHAATSHHRDMMLRSSLCGCCYCLRVFPPSELGTDVGQWRGLNGNPMALVAWIDSGATAVCPYCATDCLIPEEAGFPLTLDFLKAMHLKYFSAETLQRQLDRMRQRDDRQ